MSDRYKGAILSPTAPTVTPQSAGGIYTSSQQLQYQGQGVWPSAVNYPINNSLRFRASASAYLNRTPASAGNRKTWTYSTWIKRGAVGAEATLISGGATTGRLAVFFDSTGRLVSDVGGTGTFDQSTAVYRDPSSWYHFVWQFDTTQATAANRSRMYINGVQVSLTNTRTFTQNADYEINNSVLQTLGTLSNSLGGYNFDGYQAETYFIDGTALTPSSFGTTDAYGVWQPIPYTGAYGTNGFYLPFTDNSALTTSSNVGLGKDFSGNGNYWVTNNISITAGSTYDSMKDVPTNTNSNTANYATLNPLDAGSQVSVANGNLGVTWSSTSGHSIRATQGMTTGKWYWEVTAGANSTIGIIKQSLRIVPSSGSLWPGADGFGVGGSYAYAPDGQVVTNSSYSAYGNSFANGDVIGVAFDADNGNIYFSKNGTWQNSGNPATSTNPAFTGIASSIWCSAIGYWTLPTSNTNSFNFGQRPFAYTPPSGFYPLNTYNLPTPTILAGNQYMDATLYTGTGANLSITNAGGFQPDFVWTKSRSAASTHLLFDSIRGVYNYLISATTDAEATLNTTLTAFNSNGFSIGSNSTINNNGSTNVGWQWRASNAAGVSNTQGTITSTVSANTTAGFSIVTGTLGAAGVQSTVGHGLGVAPRMIIFKTRSGATYNWSIYHASVCDTTSKYFRFTTDALQTYSTTWGAALPTSTVFGVTGDGCGSPSNPFVAYCFAQVAGYSAFGSYTGNGSTDGPFIYTGFRPRFVIVKNTVDPNNWVTFDSARNTYNIVVSQLYPNASDAEATGSSTNGIDFLSNGFKIRSSFNWGNRNGDTIIYMAFAENPFKIARGR